MIELQQMGGGVAVGPGVGTVFGIVEVKIGVEVEVGRRLFVFQIQLGQFWVGIV